MSAISHLKRTQAFTAVYRRGRWARGGALSVGLLPNGSRDTRVGLRTRRGLKGAVVRNRLKRQLRAVIQRRSGGFRPGLDLVVVLHPKTIPTATTALETELVTLCKRLGILS